jgi:Vps51/Vps67
MRQTTNSTFVSSSGGSNPTRVSSGGGQQQPSPFAQNMAKSMTIEEMRFLHQRALNEAESKRTELKLVLASRYRELVGSSDEVIKMKERAQELHDLVQALPSLMEKLVKPHAESKEEKYEQNTIDAETEIISRNNYLQKCRQRLSNLPRVIYRAIDKNDVHKATMKLIELFTVIASCTDNYPLANSLSSVPHAKLSTIFDSSLDLQIKMIFLQVQTLPGKISRLASNVLGSAASYGKSIENPFIGAQKSAAALASLDSMKMGPIDDRADWLLNTYFESKGRLLVHLLGKLVSPLPQDANKNSGARNAEKILSKIVLILQYDIVLHPYQIFVLRDFPVGNDGDATSIMRTLPAFDREEVRAKCSKFLSSHLQLLRSKVKAVLVSIAGTTASALGQIRQSLYDKTDGLESIQKLNENGICTWDEAVHTMVDIHTVFNNASDAASDITTQKFSLWGALFSNTFSSLVHSLLTTAFQSVHTNVMTSLRASLANAPPVASILPHEAYRNTLKIATILDNSLHKVSEDAHELLVHAEERIESERRLRQSLYVQTCEILGRLICEVRRLAFAESKAQSDAAKQLIIGRLCYLLKFRLTSLPTLLSSESSPATMLGTFGMIHSIDLKSAFELADHDEDGLITFEEAMEAVESAFAGTPFHGAEMVRETLLLSADGKESKSSNLGSSSSVTIGELSLLTARGLRHETTGPESALGTFQHALDGIVAGCIAKWSSSALSGACDTFGKSLQDFMVTSYNVDDDEWCRMFAAADDMNESIAERNQKGVSPFLVGIFLECAIVLSRNTCPSDSLPPIPTKEYATSLGMDAVGRKVTTLTNTMRRTLLAHTVSFVVSRLNGELHQPGQNFSSACQSSAIQLHADVTFLQRCVLKITTGRANDGTVEEEGAESISSFQDSLLKLENFLKEMGSLHSDVSFIGSTNAKHQQVLESSDQFFSSLFGRAPESNFSPVVDLTGTTIGTSTLFHLPLNSTRRFTVLPVQADRSLNDIQLRGAYTKEKEQAAAEKQEQASGNVMSSGFGFFSSMLKKK